MRWEFPAISRFDIEAHVLLLAIFASTRKSSIILPSLLRRLDDLHQKPHETTNLCCFCRMAGSSSSGAMQRPSTRAPQPLPPPLKRTSSLPSKVAAARRAGQGAPPSAGKHLRPWAPRFDEELFAKGFSQRHVLFLPKNAERNRPIIPIEWQVGQSLPGTQRGECIEH